MQYSMRIPIESEKHINALDSIVNQFCLRPKYKNLTYDFDDIDEVIVNQLKDAIRENIPNLYLDID